MARPETIVVVGFSLAGLRAAETLRREGFDGRLICVGEESELPYDRPPLSKEILRGEWEPGRTALRHDGYDALGLELHLGQRARALDGRRRRVELEDGASLEYDGLVVATGARARSLPALEDLPGVHRLRTLADALAIERELVAGPRVVIVGAGFIGCEIAASCRARGLRVCVIDPLEAPLERALGVELGGCVAALQRDHGVVLELQRGVDRLEGWGRVEAVRLDDGRRLDADLVIVGVGAEPATEWLVGSGVELDDGVLCDACSRTALPGVVAAGDVARAYHPGQRRHLRHEHWTNAADQGPSAARALLHGAEARSYVPIPFVWSDQFDVKLQLAGDVRNHELQAVVWGSLEERRFTLLCGRGGRLTGVLCFNRSRDCMRYRALIEAGCSWEEALAHAVESS
ncbi:MAG: NAD(P)/FAD-dependent oxidoreductase [Myxococcota bacterium]